jgi:glycosyltransferase involved in cell wall biosynthesis
MVYNREAPATLPEPIQALLDEVGTSEFSVVTHARLMWHPLPGYTQEQWARESKHNDWLLRGFAEVVRRRPSLRSRLYIVAYGPDVDRTKALCKDLELDPHVRWLPVMPRRELMCLLRACDVGVGEFTRIPGAIWGGTAWEVLAAGRPLLQAFNFEPGQYESSFGHPPPPMLAVDSPEAVATHLLAMADAPEARRRLGDAAARWFEQHNGLGLARAWLELLQEPPRCA